MRNMMSDTMKQQLSSMMDGEADGNTDLTAGHLMESATLKHTWWRYQLISDALNRNLPGVLDRDLSGKLAAQIAREPAILAARRNTAIRLLKPAAGLAIAASVATIAILGIQQDSMNSPGLEEMQVTATRLPEFNTGIDRYAVPASSHIVTIRSDDADSVVVPDNAAPNARMNSYLVNFNEARLSQTGVQGINPYVRIVTNDSDN
jgi:sigma-E factor negative regulatory protein RseA